MTRTEASANLVAIGIAEPTKEQIDNYLNQFNGEIAKDKDRETKTQRLINELNEKIKTLSSEKEELETKGMSETEKLMRDLETTKNQLAEREQTILTNERNAKLSSMGISGDQLSKFFDENGGVNYDNLASILSSVRDKAYVEKEQELVGKAGNPSGGNDGEQASLTDAEKFVANMPKPNDIGKAIKGYF